MKKLREPRVCQEPGCERRAKAGACAGGEGRAMKALSLTQPWPWIIFHLGKRIENRTRNLGNYRGTLALHASKGMAAEDWWSAYDFVASRFGHVGFADQIPQPTALVRGAIVGVCEVVGQVGPDVTAIVGYDARWYMGAHAYLLSEVRELTAPIPCKGALGFWTPPANVLAQLRDWMSGGADDLHGGM